MTTTPTHGYATGSPSDTNIRHHVKHIGKNRLRPPRRSYSRVTTPGAAPTSALFASFQRACASKRGLRHKNLVRIRHATHVSFFIEMHGKKQLPPPSSTAFRHATVDGWVGGRWAMYVVSTTTTNTTSTTTKTTTSLLLLLLILLPLLLRLRLLVLPLLL